MSTADEYSNPGDRERLSEKLSPDNDLPQRPRATSAARSWLRFGFEFAEGLGGLGEGVGDGLVPVHVRAACALFPRAFLAQCCRQDRVGQLGSPLRRAPLCFPAA